MKSAYAITRLNKSGYSKKLFYQHAVQLYKEINTLMANGDTTALGNAVTEKMYSTLKNELKRRDSMWSRVHWELVEPVVSIRTLRARMINTLMANGDTTALGNAVTEKMYSIALDKDGLDKSFIQLTIESLVKQKFEAYDSKGAVVSGDKTKEVYRFDSNRVRGRISRSIRHALDQPLNYARIYLADVLPQDVNRIIYLDSDVVVVDDIQRLWEVDLGEHVVAAPEYCHANFTNYFTDAFWMDASLSKTFEGRRPCYFNTGVMVMDVDKWRNGGYTKMVENWMAVQKQKRIYHLGSLPPFLLVLAGNIQAVDHRWNQHGLGGDNIAGKCRSLHPGPISLLHWSGKGKPWLRLDSRKPCIVDHLWAPYDLYRTSSPALEG